MTGQSITTLRGSTTSYVVVFLAMCAMVLEGSSDSPAQDRADSMTNEAINYFWNAPVTGYEQIIASLEQGRADMVKVFDRICGKDHPLRPDQRTQLEVATSLVLERFVQENRAELLLFSTLTAGGLETRAGPAQAMLFGRLESRLVELENTLWDEHGPALRAWRKIAAPAQRQATREWLDKQSNARKRVNEQLMHARRRAAGEFTQKDYERLHIDPRGETDLHKLSLPAFPGPEKQWHVRVADFVRVHRLNEAQQAAARSILEECQGRAQRHREGHAAELRRLWKQLVQTYLFPKESKVTLKQSVRQFRRASEVAVRPIYEEMQRRLQDLLTTKQKTAAGPPPPKPRWLELMEIALADEDAPAAGPGKTPATRPVAEPP